MASNVILFLCAGALMFAVSDLWPAPVAAGLALVVATLVVVIADRLALVRTARARPLAGVLLALAGIPQRTRAALGVLATALDANPGAPAFVRLRLRSSSLRGLGAVTQALSARPGMVVVDAEPGTLLAHVLHEGEVNVTALQRLEKSALASVGDQT